MAQKPSAHPRVTVGQLTLVNGVLAGVAVPHMTAKSRVAVQLNTPLNNAAPGPDVCGLRYMITPIAGSFTVTAVDNASPGATRTGDQSILDYMVILDPTQT